MVNALHLRVAGECHLIEPHAAHLLKGRFEAAQALQRGVGFDEFVLPQDDLAQKVGDRHHRAVKVAAGAGMRGAPL